MAETVKPLVRQKVTKEAAVERTPIRGLVKMNRPVEGRQVKLLCAQAQGEASWAYHAYIRDFDEAVGKGAFDPDLQLIFDRPRATSHLADVPCTRQSGAYRCPNTSGPNTSGSSASR